MTLTVWLNQNFEFVFYPVLLRLIYGRVQFAARNGKNIHFAAHLKKVDIHFAAHPKEVNIHFAAHFSIFLMEVKFFYFYQILFNSL